jgi:MFS transporter, SHS family, lactate transporter
MLPDQPASSPVGAPSTIVADTPYASRWRALAAGFLGWMLDGYDHTILSFVLIEIQHEFTMTSAEAGALGTATLLMRLVGGTAAGAAADRWGRKTPLMVSILWFSIFSFLSGFSTSYTMLLFFRALFGLGMGGEWAAGMPLVIEHWPERRRGIVSGFVQGAYSWGFILAAAVTQFAYPAVSDRPWGWRAMLWSGLLPALLVFWMRRSVPESPVWLARARQTAAAHRSWRERWNGFPLWPMLLLGAVMFAYQSIVFWYGTLIRLEGQPPLAYVAALNIGGIAGAAALGTIAGTRIGPAATIALGAGCGIASLPLFVFASGPAGLFAGGLAMGLTVGGVVGVSPIYIANRFAPDRRGWSGGIAYHAAAAIGSFAPTILGRMIDNGWVLRDAMSLCVAIAIVATIVLAWREHSTRPAIASP